MTKLIHKGNVVLSDVVIAKGIWKISVGLMFAGKRKIDRGICLIMPSKFDVRHGSAVTMFFCFYDYDILFVNSKFEVVDRKILKPWTPTYIPKKSARYIFESTSGKFKNIKIGDIIELKK